MADYFLHDIDIPVPNRAMDAVLRSEQIRAAVFEVAELAQALYQAQVAKRTGRLAASAHASTEMAHVYKGQDRWVGVLTVGGTGSQGTVEYGAAHEFGTGDHPGSIKSLNRPAQLDVPQAAAHDLNRVLQELDGL